MKERQRPDDPSGAPSLAACSLRESSCWLAERGAALRLHVPHVPPSSAPKGGRVQGGDQRACPRGHNKRERERERWREAPLKAVYDRGAEESEAHTPMEKRERERGEKEKERERRGRGEMRNNGLS